MNKRFLSLFLALTLALSIFAVAPMYASAASEMTTSEECLAVIKELEGFSGKPYLDANGQYTIGYGTRCPDELVSKYMKEPMTTAEADAELRKEVVSYEKAVNAFIDRHSLTYTQGQFDGVVSLVFNCGTSWLTKGTTLIKALSGDVTENELIYSFAIYSMSSGNRSIGHVKRRLAEANMYLNQEYSRTPPEHYSYVLYKGNGGTVSEYDVQGYDAEITAEPMATATYEGYTFVGWYTEASGGVRVTKLDKNTKAMTLYARWSDGTEIPSEPDPEPDTPDKPTDTNPNGTAINPLKIKVTGSTVNLRKGPSTDYDVVKKVTKGTELTITALYNEGKYTWGKCTAGWIRLDYTDYEDRIEPPVNEPEEKPEEPKEEPEQNTTVTKVYGTVIDTDTLNVRKTPDGAIVGKLNRGDKVEILEQKTVNGRAWGRCSKGWICIRTYVKLETVQEAVSKPAEKPSEPVTQTKLYGTVINTTSQNVRSAPDGKIVGKLMKGERFEILERKTVNGREWGRCSKGWVCLRTYVKLEEVKVEIEDNGSSDNQNGGSNTTTTTTKTYATVVGTDSLNVRVSPDGTICGTLKRGEKVEILERKTVNGREWGRCSKGWICLRTYAKLETVTETVENSKLIGKVTASALNIRSNAGTEYSVVGKLYNGETVEILEKKTVDGTVWGRCSKGWICLDYVQF